MAHQSELAPALLTAYRRTEYQVGQTLLLRIDVQSEDLERWQQRHGVGCSAFISAVNPRSAALGVHENRVRHERLRNRLGREGLHFEEGQGVDPERRWPPEVGFLVAGLDQAHARRFGREFDQNAVVWSGPDAVPQLLLLR
ncbi:MAG: DUF3293 domain-containing protein [Wenzhouxiangella sp.]